MALMRLFLFMLFLLISFCGASRLSHFHSIHVNTFKSRDGDVIDCIDVDSQPAFDHPLLKNLELQIEPSKFPQEADGSSSSMVTSIRKNDDVGILSCPDGSVAVMRNTNEEVVHGRSFGTMMNTKRSSQANEDLQASGFAHSQYAFLNAEAGEYYGARAIMNIWEPHVQPNEFSSSYIYLTAGSQPNLNAIIVGWGVNPSARGDNRTRFFVSWTRDSFATTGCRNLICPGFVQVNNKVILGAPFPVLSTINGSQIEISILIWKTPDAWWVQYNGELLGYWPVSIFSDLANNASAIGWGGNVFNSGSDQGFTSTTTQMGSGHFPKEGFGIASYMRNLRTIDEKLTLRSPSSSLTTSSVEQPDCYNITQGNDNLWGDFIFYGGPGRNPNCQ